MKEKNARTATSARNAAGADAGPVLEAVMEEGRVTLDRASPMEII